MNAAACSADHLDDLLQPSSKEDGTTIDSQISKANKPMHRRIDGHMFVVFNVG